MRVTSNTLDSCAAMYARERFTLSSSRVTSPSRSYCLPRQPGLSSWYFSIAAFIVGSMVASGVSAMSRSPSERAGGGHLVLRQRGACLPGARDDVELRRRRLLDGGSARRRDDRDQG
jgi:hypothetical protein